MQIGVVLVTYNRLDKLKKSLSLYENQTLKPKYILVVDNNSSDGTKQYLEKWENERSDIKHILKSLHENIGGSGGFSEGVKEAQKIDAEWIWLADDDAFPNINAFMELKRFKEEYSEEYMNCASICSQNVSTEGKIATGHRSRVKWTIFGRQVFPVKEIEYSKNFFEMDVFSFVGACIRKSAVQQAGIPRRDFFIYADDYEYSFRIKKSGRILCVPSIKVIHDDNICYTKEASWRDYYMTRNYLLATKWHLGSWSYRVRKVSRMLTALRTLNLEKVKVFRDAIVDAEKSNLGINEIYKPGWKPKK